MIKNIIFDFDGTLVDSMSVWDSLGEKYLLSQGIIAKPDLKEQLMTMNLPQSIQYLKKEYHLPLNLEEIEKRINDVLGKEYLEYVDPKPGVREFLEYLKDQDKSVVIATAADKTSVKELLDKRGLSSFVEEVFSSSEHPTGKTEPHVFVEALDYLSGSKENTLVFEDAVFAAKTAKNAGFKVIGIKDKIEIDQQKLKELCDYYIESFEELEKLKKILKGEI